MTAVRIPSLCLVWFFKFSIALLLDLRRCFAIVFIVCRVFVYFDEERWSRICKRATKQKSEESESYVTLTLRCHCAFRVVN